MSKRVRFIYFDVGGVLLDWIPSQKKVAAKYNVPEKDIERIVDTHWEHTGRGGNTDMYMKDLANLIRLQEPYPDVTDFWTDFHEPILQTHELVQNLKSLYRLGLLTNAEKNAMHHALRKGLIPDINWHAIIDSSVYKALKPEQKIYEIAERAAGVLPSEIFFTDDKPENVSAAIKRGWKGMVFDTNNAVESVRRITTLLL